MRKHNTDRYEKWSNHHIPAMAAGVLLLATPVLARDADRKITDTGVTLKIESEYLTDSAVPYNDIDVMTTEGIVTLNGETDNLLAKERATVIAETVKGVRSVVNLIKVSPSGPTDRQALEKRVDGALARDPATDSFEIKVSADDHGHVTLSGSVDSWQEKDLAETVAKGVRGVTGVENDITAVYKLERADSEIQADIEQRLRWNALVDDGLIRVSVKEEKVMLTGTVGSAAERRGAWRDAWVSGVDEVDDSGLKVERWARDEDLRKDKYIARSPEEIRDALKDAFFYDPRVHSFEIEPLVSYGTVILRGTVDNLRAKHAAERVTRHTVGVDRVYNRLKVRSDEQIADAELETQIELALASDPYVDGYEIDIDVVSGSAFLRGEVDSPFEKAKAWSTASSVAGVKDVKNRIDVADSHDLLTYNPYVWSHTPFPWNEVIAVHPPTIETEVAKTDMMIKENIEDELFWSPFVDHEQVNVEVDAGTATLSGTVYSKGEAEAAVENALEGGATKVDNNLAVK